MSEMNNTEPPQDKASQSEAVKHWNAAAQFLADEGDRLRNITDKYGMTDMVITAMSIYGQHTAAAETRELTAQLNTLRENLDEALTHLHWLTIGGEFSHEVADGRAWCMASMKEYEQAREFTRVVRKRLAATTIASVTEGEK